MPEEVTLTTPVTKPSRTKLRLERVTLDIETKSFHIQWLGDNGDAFSAVYDDSTTPTGRVLLTALNTANLTGNSLVRRIFNRLLTDGHIPAGTIGGTPD